MAKPSRIPHSGSPFWEWFAVFLVLAAYLWLLGDGARRSPEVDLARIAKSEYLEIARVVRQLETDGGAAPGGTWKPEMYLPLMGQGFARARTTGEDPYGTPFGPVPAGQSPEIPARTLELVGVPLYPGFWSPLRAAQSPAPPSAND